MENEILTNNSPVQPVPQVSVPQSINWSKILLFTVLGLIIIAGSVFIGIQIGKTQTYNQQPVVVQPTAFPTETVANPTNLPTTSITETSTVDPTANWKTYTNSTYKFLIKYPSNWISKSYTPADSRIPYLYNPDNKYNIQFGYHKDEPSVISEMTGKPMVTDLSNYKFTTINGIKVYVNNNLQGNDGNYMKYYFQISDGEYISILAPLTNAPSNVAWNDAAVSLVKQILSTFKFTN